MNKISRKSFLRRDGVKTLYFMTLFTLAALAGVGLFIVPGFNKQVSVSAQENAKQVAADGETATAEMLRIALDFRTATGYAVFAEKGISVKGKSQIKGSTGIARHDAETGARAQKDLSGAFNAISQLPATEINELSSGSFRAGVYSAPSAKLSGNLILDAESDPNAIFIFRVAGALRAENKLKITLVNGAEPHNVFFLAKGTATIGEGIEFTGSILAEDEVTIGRGSKVFGKALSLGGAVKLTEAAVSGGTGFLEICKDAEGPGLDGRIFAFRIGGIVREAPVGGCTGPIELPAGPVTVEELLTGSTISPLPIGTFEGRFRLISVTSSVPGSLGTVNLPLRTAVVNIREAGITNQTVLTFTNTFAVNAVVEICKRAADNSPDVTGFFNFTIDELSNTVITVPVGFCSGPIQVNVPTIPNSAVTNGLIDTLLKPGQGTKSSGGYSTPGINSPSDGTSSDVISRFVNVFYAALFAGNSTATADSPTFKATATAPSLVGVAPSLGTAGSFGVLAASSVTNTGSTIVTGNLGVSPGTAVSGFPPGTVVGGTIHAGDAVAAQARTDATTAYNNLAGQACDVNLTGTDLGGLTLTPGVYCFSSSAQLTGILTLNAQGNPNAVFIFKIGSTLITASNSTVSVINGGTGCNVFFQVGSSATLGTGTRFTGNILALTSITLNTNANIIAGRALALNGV